MVPTISHFVVLWYANLDVDESDETQEFFMQVIGINGCVEAPLQLIMTLFLVLKGIFDFPWSTEKISGEILDKFGNRIPLFSIPLLSFIFSSISIVKNVFKMNISKFNEETPRGKLRLIGGHFPFFSGALCLRVMAYSFIIIFFNYYAVIPFLLVLICNVASGYYVDEFMKKLYEEDDMKIYTPIWLNSFIGVFVPCCSLDFTLINQEKLLRIVNDEMKHNVEHEQTDDDPAKNKNRSEFLKNYQKTVVKIQIISSTVILLLSVVTIACLVNFTDFKYNSNILNNFNFNILWIVLCVMGAANLIFLIDTNVYEIVKQFEFTSFQRILPICHDKVNIIYKTLISLIFLVFVLREGFI